MNFIKRWIVSNQNKILYTKTPLEYAEAVHNSNNGLFFNVNLYALGHLCSDPEFQTCFNNCKTIGVDGVGASILIYLSLKKWYPPYGYKEWGDIYLQMLSEEKILLLGGTNKEIRLAAETIKSIVDPSNEVFYINGYENTRFYINMIKEISPTVCFVGMGMPTQEKLMVTLWGKNKNCKYLSCGGWFKQLAGLEYCCPKPLLYFRLEWVWRSLFRRGHIKNRVIKPLIKIITTQWPNT